MRDDGAMVTLVDALLTLVILGAASAVLLSTTLAPDPADESLGPLALERDAGRLAAVAPLVTIERTSYRDVTGAFREAQSMSIAQLVALDASLREEGGAYDGTQLRADVAAEVARLAGPSRQVAFEVDGSFTIPANARPPEVRSSFALVLQGVPATLYVWEG